ncbi:hypothetical protein ANCCEY_04985 [Ancylostoma ceylanicum]|uniref:Serpentine Receptor, class H n=1 Tax=Ancylostoma ceylanicum TaxID=53326 RepID=A0A0D6LVS1_9BILA|nr:hypothetical protein ANCCEY_04985 [Ancylostoma ceylanicum]
MDTLRDFVDYPPINISVMRYSCVYSIPIYMLSMYCVLFVTAPKSGNYKWIVAYHCTISFLFELILNVGMTPISFVPIIGGYTAGFMSVLKIPLTWQIVIVIILLSETGTSIAQLFHYQYQQMVPENYFLRIQPLVTNLLFLPSYLFGFILNPAFILINIPDQALVKKKLQDEYVPIPESLLSNSSIIIVDSSKIQLSYYLIPVLVNLIAGVIGCLYFAFSITHYLYASDLFRSQQLLKLQKAVMVELCIKTSVSLGVFAIPAGIVLVSLLVKQTSQDLINYCIYCVSSMGTAGNVGMLLSSPRYRIRLKQLFLGIRSRYKDSSKAVPKTKVFSSGKQHRRMFVISSRGFSLTA